MKKLIELDAALDALNRIEISRNASWYEFYQKALTAVGTLPSAQPTDAEIQRMQDIEQAALEKAYECGKQDAIQWIPCSERLPEYGTAVLTYNNDDEYEINHIIDEDDGEWFFNGAVAWMPLPEPWKGEEHGTSRAVLSQKPVR